MKRLRRYLEDNGLTQAEFADRIGVTQSAVWFWLNNESTPSVENLKDISRVTGITIDELLDHKTPKTRELRQ
jgi:transcriptional regulator with XRE-family HTH domain